MSPTNNHSKLSSCRLILRVFFCLFFSILSCHLTALAASTTEQTVNWEDSNITAGSRVRAIHIQQIRNEIDAKRTAAGLPQFNYADSTIVPGVTRVRAIHFLQLEQAIQEYYEKVNSTSLPGHVQTTGWQDWFALTHQSTLVNINPNINTPVDLQPTSTALANTPIRATHIRDLRTAMEQTGYCGDGFCQIYNGKQATDPSALPESCGAGKCDTDCNNECNTVTLGCGPESACGCVGGQKCHITTCYCKTTFSCIPDPTCPTSCAPLAYPTSACGIITLPITPLGSSASVGCGSGCSGNLTALCDPSTAFILINDGCTQVCNNNSSADNGETGTDCGGGGCPACNPSCNGQDCYSCSGTSCVSDSGGSFAISNCNNTCVAPSCNNNSTQDNGETGTDCGGGGCPACAPTCSDGAQNGSETGVDCGGSCPACAPYCGDGIVQTGEECDYGANNGNCASGYDCSPTCTAYYCVSENCGNGVIDSGEQCDPGLALMGPCQWSFACSLACTNQSPPSCGTGTCGDGYIDPGEECDNFNQNGPCPLDCSATCTNNTGCAVCPAQRWSKSQVSHRSTGWGCFRDQQGGMGGTAGGNGLVELSGCCDSSASPYPNNFRYWTNDNIDCCCPPDGMGGYLPCGCENIVLNKMVQNCE